MVEEQVLNEVKEVSDQGVTPEPEDKAPQPEKQKKEKKKKEKKREKGSGLFSKLGFFKIPLLLVLVCVLAVTTALVITKVSKGNAATNQEQAKAKEEKKKEVGKFITLDPFTVNLMGGQNYLQTAIAFEIKGENTELEKEVEDRKPQINDVIISILSSKTIDDISDNEGREKLKTEIKKAVDSLLSYGKIERVYFTTFIMQ